MRQEVRSTLQSPMRRGMQRLQHEWHRHGNMQGQRLTRCEPGGFRQTPEEPTATRTVGSTQRTRSIQSGAHNHMLPPGSPEPQPYEEALGSCTADEKD